MKRSDFIKQVLSDTENTVCVNFEQVEVMLEIFEKLDMFYCPVEDFGDFKLRSPKGWEVE
jgi:hypothetical protein